MVVIMLVSRRLASTSTNVSALQFLSHSTSVLALQAMFLSFSQLPGLSTSFPALQPMSRPSSLLPAIVLPVTLTNNNISNFKKKKERGIVLPGIATAHLQLVISTCSFVIITRVDLYKYALIMIVRPIPAGVHEILL